jgi:DNA invertase Pin-like site-specific DNA recombinase
VANKRRSNNELNEIDAILERLREFIRFGYVTASEVARRLDVRDLTVYSWLQGRLNRRTHGTLDLLSLRVR